MSDPIAPPTCSDAPIWSVWMSAFHAPALAIADELGVFTALADAPATADELAARLAIELRASETLLGLMAALGFVAQADARFALTDVAQTYLLPASPYYWGGLLKRIRDLPLDCNKLIAALRRGSAAAQARVTEMWQAPRPPPEALASFTHAMHAHSFALAMRVVDSFALAPAQRMLDVGGGSGSYAIAAALRHRQLACAVLDLPAVCDVATRYAEQHGVADRIAMVGADMFADAWPSGVDRVLFSDIFHDWDDERCRLLARRAYDSLAPGGEVLVHEMLLGDGKDGPLAAMSYSMVMVFVAQGRQRTGRETAEILASAGFADITIAMTSGGYALVRAKR